MLSDEEKKAVEWLKKATFFSARLYAPTVLNLIEKTIKEIKQKDKIIDEILKTWKQDDVRSIAELKKYFEERCK